MRSLPILDRMHRELSERRQNGLFRSIAPCIGHEKVTDCSTNSYLGLHANSEVADAAAALVAHHGHSGNLASRLIAEISPLYSELEAAIASWEGTEAALVFTSGYTANVGIIAALCTRDTEVFSDRLNHASIYDGIRLAGCRLQRYRHIDMADLKSRLAGSKATEKIIITDTVFSMDGDRAPLADIAELAAAHNALVMVDEAHATGIFGSGLVEATGTGAAIDVRMGTLSKALAGLGGYVASSLVLRDYFVNFCRSLIYSTGLPHAVLAHNLAAIRYVRQHPAIGSALLAASERFRELVNSIGFTTAPSSTQIIPCLLRTEREACALAAYLHERGITVPAIRPPTVPVGTARLRFSWSHLFSDDDGRAIAHYLQTWKKMHE